MNKVVKVFLIIAFLLVIGGSIIFITGLAMNGFDFSKLSTNEYETNTYDINEDFLDIKIEDDVTDIEFIYVRDGKCKVVCYETSKLKHSVSVVDNALSISVINNKNWYDYIGINFSSPKLTIYLPKNEYRDVVIKDKTGDIIISKDLRFKNIDFTFTTGSVKCYASADESINFKGTTGDIYIENVSADVINASVSTGQIKVIKTIIKNDITIRTSTGDVILENIISKNLKSSGSTGDILLKNVNVSEKLMIDRNTGDILFDRSDAGEIIVETSTGDVKGTLLSNKIFITKTDTGDEKVPSSITGGKCEITTDTGDIEIEIAK